MNTQAAQTSSRCCYPHEDLTACQDGTQLKMSFVQLNICVVVFVSV